VQHLRAGVAKGEEVRSRFLKKAAQKLFSTEPVTLQGNKVFLAAFCSQ
jgi:hypothetical protein